MTDLVDRGDWCRACGGRGNITEPHPTEPGRTIAETCHQCGGTGLRTVTLTVEEKNE